MKNLFAIRPVMSDAIASSAASRAQRNARAAQKSGKRYTLIVGGSITATGHAVFTLLSVWLAPANVFTAAGRRWRQAVEQVETKTGQQPNHSYP
jgi:hypothetical protein